MTSKAGSRLRHPEPISEPVGGRTAGERAGDPPQTHHAAKIQPLDVTGVRTVAVGAGLWFVAFLVLLPFYGALRDQGRGWWLWTCVAGLGLGLVGLEYCRRRRSRLASQPAHELETSPLGAAGV